MKKKKTEDEEVCHLTPKAIFFSCLADAHLLIDDINPNRDAETAWELFEIRMMKHGYIKDE